MKRQWTKKLQHLTRLFLGTVLLTVIYHEFLIYFFLRWKWTRIECEESRNCTRILLVADPQLLGETFDQSFYARAAIWDSDRHLEKTFDEAFIHSRPDLVIFLGDVMDEGSVATLDEFRRYLKRFWGIFKRSGAQTIVISGDNDVGGEYGERIRPSAVRRFKVSFDEKDYWQFKDLIFYNVNRITHTKPAEGVHETNFNAKILLSHLPVLPDVQLFTKSAIDTLDPSLIFSAHEHESALARITYERLLKMPIVHRFHFSGHEPINVLSEFNLTKLTKRREILEILVPTCSYRMGMRDTGYGFAVIEDDRLAYTVLWLPRRFEALWGYVILIMITVLYFLFTRIVPLALIPLRNLNLLLPSKRT